MADSLVTSVKFLQFLTQGLCGDCMKTMSNRIRSLHADSTRDEDPLHAVNFLKMCHNDSQSHENHESCGENSLGSLKDGVMAPEEELEEGEIRDSRRLSDSRVDVKRHKRPRAMLGDYEMEMEMEYSRFMDVRRKKNFVCLERIRGKTLNILEGLELHNGVFSSAEQRTIVDFVYSLQKMGKRGQLMERTYCEPTKWMRGKGRVTIQFGCCYNYATDKKGNPPGILRREVVDPIPHLLKVIIRRLVRWHVLPPSCVPDSCIINIYEEGDCIPPHIDNHDFVRPFCTVSFLSQCDILFGSSLKIVGPGEFSGSSAISLPVGSVLVLKGNGADVAKHCVPAVPAKRISITFRKMDDKKRPCEFVPEADLQGIQPLSSDFDKRKRYNVEDDSKGYTSKRGKMDDKKGPCEFVPEADLQGIQPLSYDFDKQKRYKVEDDSKGYTSKRGKMDDKKRPCEFVPEADLQGIQPLSSDFDKRKRYKVEDDRRAYTSKKVRRSAGMV